MVQSFKKVRTEAKMDKHIQMSGHSNENSVQNFI